MYGDTTAVPMPNMAHGGMIEALQAHIAALEARLAALECRLQYPTAPFNPMPNWGPTIY